MNPSTSFKRGDRVKATNTLFEMHGTVVSVGAFTGLVRVRWDARTGTFGKMIPTFTEYVHPSHLALVSRDTSQATFSKGDVVEITSPHPSLEYVGALGVVVKILEDRPTSIPRIQVKPYKPSKPFEKLSNGPFTYSHTELKARRANGLVPVNFVREALGLRPVTTPGGRLAPDPQNWTLVGTTVDGGGVYTGPTGSTPPKAAPTTRHEGSVSIDILPSPEATAWLDALTQPTSIRITDDMRRRGVTTESDIRQIDDANRSMARRNASLSAKLDEANRRLEQGTDITDLVQRAESAEHESRRQRARADFTKRLLNESREGRERADSLARDLADEKDRLRDALTRERNAGTFNDQARVAEADKLRAERDELKRKVAEYNRREIAQLFGPSTVPQLQDELHRAHVSRQQAENERDELKVEVRDLKNQLGSAVNRSRRRGEAIERIQNAVRGL